MTFSQTAIAGYRLSVDVYKRQECSENGVDRLGLFRIGKYPVFRRNVLRPVVILLEARDVAVG